MSGAARYAGAAPYAMSAKASGVTPIDVTTESAFPTSIEGDYEAFDGTAYGVTIKLGPEFPMISLQKGDIEAVVVAPIIVGRLNPKAEGMGYLEVPEKFFRMVATFSTYKNATGDTLMLYRDLVDLRWDTRATAIYYYIQQCMWDTRATAVYTETKNLCKRDLGMKRWT